MSDTGGLVRLLRVARDSGDTAEFLEALSDLWSGHDLPCGADADLCLGDGAFGLDFVDPLLDEGRIGRSGVCSRAV
jgi:hypothetical protein